MLGLGNSGGSVETTTGPALGDMLCGRIASGRRLEVAGTEPDDGRFVRAAGPDESGRSTRGGSLT